MWIAALPIHSTAPPATARRNSAEPPPTGRNCWSGGAPYAPNERRRLTRRGAAW